MYDRLMERAKQIMTRQTIVFITKFFNHLKLSNIHKLNYEALVIGLSYRFHHRHSLRLFRFVSLALFSCSTVLSRHEQFFTAYD